MSEPRIGFELRKLQIPLDDILPVRKVEDIRAATGRYKTILTSLKEVGQVEPLVVHPQKNTPGKFVLLNGHRRYAALRELGKTNADCIIATDDECFTYNARVNRLPPIQEHKMIVKAVKNGISEKRLSAALNMSYRSIIAAINLLKGIHEDAAELLRDKTICADAIRLLRRVNSLRQIEIVELMVAANCYTIGYAEALVLATPREQMADPSTIKRKAGISSKDIARMEQEMASLEQEIKAVGESYTENMFNLTCARGYIKKLMENQKVARFLGSHHPDIFTEFENVAAIDSV